MRVPISGESNEAAYTGLWQQRSADAMNLAALMGDPSGKNVREAFDIAAKAAEKYGYSAEEGMDTVRQAMYQGLDKNYAADQAKEIFQYERSTGADRGTLSSIANISARHGMGDSLRAGWGGLAASGMSSAQYGEYLRALQRTLEDGINRGFKLSADQVATSLTMLSQMSNNNPIWKGEHGERRLSEMNKSLESATGLKSATDIRVFRAAQKIAKEEGLGDSYWEAQKIVEQGMGGKYGTRLLHETMKFNMAAEGGGFEDVGESVMQQFGFGFNLADQFLKDWLQYKDMDSKAFAALWESHKAKYVDKPLPDTKSPELEWAQLTAQTANNQKQTGQIKFDELLPEVREERDNALAEYDEQKILSADTTGMSPQEANNHYLKVLEAARRAKDPQTARWAEGVAQNLEADVWNQERDEMINRRDMLMKTGMSWDKDKATFFTGSGTPSKNDDEKAYDNFTALEKRVGYDASPERYYLDQVYAQLGKFDNAQREEVNRNDDLNRILAQSDLTAQRLYEAVVKLAEQMDVNIVYEQN
jgi:hypothetical protein